MTRVGFLLSSVFKDSVSIAFAFASCNAGVIASPATIKAANANTIAIVIVNTLDIMDVK
jgi:hypothetical protein